MTIRIFQGDTIPDITLTVIDRRTGLPRNLTDATIEAVVMVGSERFTCIVTPVSLTTGVVTIESPPVTARGTGVVQVRVTEGAGEGADVQTVYSEALRVRPSAFPG
jgi:hypothetical protein